MKKLISVLLAASTLCISAQAAEFTAVCDSQKKTINITISDDRLEDGKKLVFYIVDEDSMTDDMSAEALTGGIVGFAEAESMAGLCEDQITYSGDIKRGYYYVVVSDYMSEDDIEEIPLKDRCFKIYVSDDNEISEVLKAVNEGSIPGFENVLTQYADLLSINKTYINSQSAAAFIALKGGASYSELSEIQDCFETAGMIGQIKTLYSDELIAAFEKYSKEFDISIDDEYQKIKSDMASVYSEIRTPANPNDNNIIDSTSKEIRTARALACINNGTRVTITDILKKYNDIFGVDLNGDYAKLDKIEVNKALENKNFKSAADVAEAFEKKLNSMIKESKPSSGGGGGGGGVSQGAQQSLPYTPSTAAPATETPSTPEPVTTPENETENNIHDFKDMGEASWAVDAVGFLYKKGVISGYSDSLFCPNKPITREEFVKMLVLALGQNDADAEYSFADGSKDDWYSVYIASAAKAGWVQGRDDNIFGIGENITRQDMAAIVYRAVGKSGDQYDYNVAFDDFASVSDYAQEAVMELSKRSIINGMDNNSFCPLETATRAQAAQIIYKLLNEGDNQ